MISELRTSVASILYERTSSPLFGAFSLSWLAWNWKIPYVTFFVSEHQLLTTKIEWITSNGGSLNTLLWYPLLSTVFLVLIVPFLSNGAYWVSIRFNKWRLDARHSIEKKTMLTLEQSLALREEILDSEKRLERLLEGKNKELKDLTEKIAHLESEKKFYPPLPPTPTTPQSIAPTPTPPGGSHINDRAGADDSKIDDLVRRIRETPELKVAFEIATKYIQGGWSGLVSADNVSSKALAFLEANEIIASEKGSTYKFTAFGKKVTKRYLEGAF